MLLSVPIVFGQNQITVKGTIVDEDGQPVFGAAIMQKGTTNGVTTDFDGNFQFMAPAGSILEITFIGYATQEVTAAPTLLCTRSPTTSPRSKRLPTEKKTRLKLPNYIK
ncbi:MAG: carboxypeptidase-like regulatory domain-containing protein [Bacteroidales bacterium]|nr:carboxypeptidase-like regulatory domain-containing protein [Bacteroidales bacterium]